MQAVRRRYRGKQTPDTDYTKHIIREHNISVAYATAPPDTSAVKQAIVHQKALVTRGDLEATKQISGSHKRRLVQESGLPLNKQQRVDLIHDKSIQHKKTRNNRPHHPQATLDDNLIHHVWGSSGASSL